jgi:hypothetical protein
VLERPVSRQARRGASPGAARQAEHRQREREGVRCYWVPIPDGVIAALIDRGLPPGAALDPKAVGHELGTVLRQWAERWRLEKDIS